MLAPLADGAPAREQQVDDERGCHRREHELPDEQRDELRAVLHSARSE